MTIMSDTEFLNDSDQDVSESHPKLIEAVSQLDKGQRIKKPERSEPTLEVSEFHLVKSGVSDKDAIQIQDLAKSLGRKGHHINITKKLQAVQKKAQVLPKPLEKPAAERIKRVVGFENTQKDVQKWGAVISSNRTTDHIKFPLSRPSFKSESNPLNTFLKRFRLQSDLEKELAKLEPKKEEPQEKEDDFSLTLEEIMEKRNEAARFRAQQSYREAKANRQKKIKSKKFHRIQRREKTKQELKEFEELQKTDPEAALKKLELLDQNRAKERMSLRHKSTGQWAKNKLIKAKYDKDTRQALAEQLSISRELTQKIRMAQDSDEDDNDIETDPQLPTSNKDDDNPWMKQTKTESEIDEFISSYRKYWDERNKESGKNTNTNTNNIDVAKETENTSSRSQSSNIKKFVNPVTEVIIENSKQEVEDQIRSETGSDSNRVVEKSENRKNKKIENVTVKNDKNINGLPKSNGKKIIENDISPTKLEKSETSIENSSTKNTKKNKVSRKTISTSAWDVQSVTSKHDSDDVPNVESIDELFNKMEEKIEDKVKSKLQGIKRKNDSYSGKIPNKKRTINVVNKEYDDDYKGLRNNNKIQKPVIDEPMIEEVATEHSQQDTDSQNLKDLINDANKLNVQSAKTNNKMEIDVNKYINVKPKHLNTQMPDISVGGIDTLDDSETDDREEQHNLISEAFADDDVVDEFRKEKEEVIKSSQPEDIDLTLPGWGSWGGRNIKISKRKKKRFIIKVPKDAPRRDENKGDVIIYEDNDPKIKKHQVNELPYPFTSVKDFEASIRAPLGRNFVPENAHNRLIMPTVERSIGTIIEPMDESVLIDKKMLKKIKQSEKKKKEEANKQQTKSTTKNVKGYKKTGKDEKKNKKPINVQ